ncbi:hypothetical protein [Robertmurraya massiliosenegalensis]|uniref:hypothetical protein n=1 Tax=Robertmurraya massiliosenegalensis TaxID=1287657 RepID=UPI000305157D|nr:hypothetical protein [Robertmurraya massiliosenegalensis]
MMNKERTLFYWIGSLLLIVAIGAISAGIGFILEPDGHNIGMSVDLLRNSPFEDFFIPGIVLFTINGVGSLIGSIIALKRHPLTCTVTIVLGMIMMIWIGVQVYWIGLISILQPIFFGIGMMEIVLGIVLFRRVR